MPITHTVLETARDHPQRSAIVTPDGSLSYAELVDDARRMFAAVDSLHRAQTTPPRPAPETNGVPITAVSVSSAFHTARIVAGLAGYRAVSATIDPSWPLAHRVRVVLTTGIAVVISDDEAFAQALRDEGWRGTCVTLAEFRMLEAQATPAGPATVRAGDEAFLLLFSSGTTSDPKAFVKTRDQYRANVAVSSAYLEPLPGVATLAPGPLSYSLTLYALIECLATGGSAHLADTLDPVGLGGRIRNEKITRVVAVPAVVRSLVDAARRHPDDFDKLELVVTGGANLPATLRENLAHAVPHARLISYYGAAEIGFIGDSRDGDGTWITVYETIGAQIRDDAGGPVADGELGTLWIRAAACSDGYIAATTTAQLRDADGWATVHDQARLVNGRLQLVGRQGDIAITGGHKVALPEVERAFDDLPGLGAVCAIAEPHPVLGTIVGLVVETDIDRQRLREWAKEHLAPQFVPVRWYRLDPLPRTVGGKIRRGETLERVTRGEAARL